MFFLWSTETSHIIVWLQSIIICNNFNILNKHYQLFSFWSLRLYVTNPWLLACLDASIASSATHTTRVRLLRARCCHLTQGSVRRTMRALLFPGQARGAGQMRKILAKLLKRDKNLA